MAKKPDAAPAEKPAADDAAQPAKKSGLPKKMIIIGGVAVAQIGLLYGATKLFGGGPQPVMGDEGAAPALHGQPPEVESLTAELEVLKSFRVPNESRGRLFIYDLDISVKVRAYRKPDLEKIIADRKSEISDRVASIIRSATQDMLHEPDLRTLRGKLLSALGEVAGDHELVLEVLIPALRAHSHVARAPEGPATDDAIMEERDAPENLEPADTGHAPPQEPPAADGGADAPTAPLTGDEVRREMEAAIAAERGADASAAAAARPSSAPSTAAFSLPGFSESAAESQGSDLDLLDDVELEVTVELGRAEMYIEDVLRLGAGSVIELDRPAGDPVDVYVNKRLVARGEVLVLNDNFCIRINEIVSPAPEPEG